MMPPSHGLSLPLLYLMYSGMAAEKINTEDFIIKTKDNKFDGFSREEEGSWKGPFCFIQGSDTQFGFIDLIAGKSGKDITWEAEIELTKKAIESAHRLQPKPRFFVVCGDLVDAYQGDEIREGQENSFRESFKNLDSSIPLVCVCGNHDVGNSPTPETIKHYRDKFGDDYFSFWVGGVKFLTINSQYYKDPSKVLEYKAEQDEWLDKELADANAHNSQHIVIFQHIPWFLQSPSEENDPYFNIEKELRTIMLNKLKAAGVRAIFCGHYHRNAGGFDEDMEVIVTSAIGAQLGTDKSGMRIVKVLENEIKHNYYDLNSFPTEVNFDS